MNSSKRLILPPVKEAALITGRLFLTAVMGLALLGFFPATAQADTNPVDLVLGGECIACVQGMVSAGAAVAEILISACNNDPGTSNVVAVTPVNVNTRYSTKGSSVTAYNTCTGNTGTAPTGISTLYRVYSQVDTDAVSETALFEQGVYAPLWGQGTPAIIGNDKDIQAFLVCTANGTSSTGYILAAWAEFTFDEFYA